GEVETLLAHEHRVDDFLSKPIAAVAAQVIVDGPTASLVGRRLGVYEIRGAVGKGGMGVVYRAHDTRLNRDVAVKVLSASIAMSPQRLARFQREAHVLAALNHPNGAQIPGVEDSL